MNGLFVTGTNTGVGKTFVTCAIARELRRRGVNVGAYKPVCSGSEHSESGEFWADVEQLSDALDRRFDDARICPQRFSAPLAPPAAASREGRLVDHELLLAGLEWWSDRVDATLIEGVGGWLSPIADGVTVGDFAADAGFPVLIVVGLELGAVNHTLLTVESIQQRGLPIAGIVANSHRDDVDPTVMEATLAGIREHASTPVVARIDFDTGELHLAESFPKVDLLRLFGPGIPSKGGNGV